MISPALQLEQRTEGATFCPAEPKSAGMKRRTKSHQRFNIAVTIRRHCRPQREETMMRNIVETALLALVGAIIVISTNIDAFAGLAN
jgi:hypothetical protein